MIRSIFVIFVYLALVFSTAFSDGPLDNYLGCYRNFLNQTSIPQTFVNQTMTIEMCLNSCINNNSTFAGLQDGNRCLCGEDFLELVSENNCTKECSGNSSQYCGGTNGQSISVYSVCSIGYFGISCDKVCHCNLQTPCQRLTGLCPSGCDSSWVGQTCNIANASPMMPKWYIGCYGDGNPNAMDAKNPDGTTGYGTNINSISICLNICARFNYTYIGTQYYFDCNCGETYSKYGPSNGCTYPCSSNSSQMCGGYFANSVYSVCPIGSYSLNCLSRCNCLNDSRCIYRNGTCPAGCKPGWTGSSCNIRDCSVANGDCNGPNESCESIDLKFATKTRCSCEKGFTKNKPWDNNCTDIDECLDIDSTCGTNAYNCTNTVGGFICGYCSKGLILQNDTCILPTIPTIPSGPTKNSKTGLIVGVVLGSILFLVIVAIVGFFIYRRKLSNTGIAGHGRLSKVFAPKVEEKIIRSQNENGDGVAGESSYYNVVLKSTRIKIESLFDVVNRFNGNAGVLQKEFKSVPFSSGDTSDIGKRKELKKKNRFKNILPYDHNRVILSTLNGQNLSDYINASYITGYSESDKLIATQGPNVESMNDFWRMICEKRVSVIVMMTKLHENGKTKCEKYWPDVGEVLTCGEVSIRTESEQEWDTYEQRSLSVTWNSKTLEILQWHYTEWPDHGFPQNARSFLTFRRKVRNSMSPDSYTVIHCSAGVGRTGGFIAIDYLLQEAKTGYVDVLSCLKNLRQQRTSMIQTHVQYEFVYTALLEQFRAGDTVLRVDDFGKRLNELRIKDPNSRKTKLEIQFEMLDEQKGAKTGNKTKDARNDAVIMVQGTRPSVRYLVKPISLNDKPEEFWKLHVDHRSKLSIFVNENQGELSFVPRNGKPLSLSNFDLVLDSTTEEKCVTICKIKLIQHSVYANEGDASEAQAMTLLNVNVTSSPNGDCVDYESLSEAYALMKRHTNTLNSPIIITSQNDEQLIGFCVAAFNAFDMIGEENEVDIYQIVHDIRISNSRFIQTLNVYEQLHDLVKQYIESSSYSDLCRKIL